MTTLTMAFMTVRQTVRIIVPKSDCRHAKKGNGHWQVIHPLIRMFIPPPAARSSQLKALKKRKNGVAGPSGAYHQADLRLQFSSKLHDDWRIGTAAASMPACGLLACWHDFTHAEGTHTASSQPLINAALMEFMAAGQRLDELPNLKVANAN